MNAKSLSDMTSEQLWQLFPIRLTEHRDGWAVWYNEESTRLLAILDADQVIRISHIGSTAVPGLWAKPTVDILLEVSPKYVESAAECAQAGGYLRMSESPSRVSLNRGYTPNGFADRVFHLHIRVAGDNDELYFRDYLKDHRDIAEQYQELKLSLWHRFEHNRDIYTATKTDFIKTHTELAKQQYAGRYDS